MIIRDWKKDLFTIPNLLSLFRLLLIPVYVIIYLQADSKADYALAAGILAVSCLTDAIDGKIARRFHMISTIGKFLDPLADKATQFTLTVCLAIHYPVLWNLVGLFIIKEGFQLIAGIVQFRKGKMLTGALFSGKVCTTILFVSLILLVLLPDMPTAFINWITAVDAVFMLISLAHYALTYYRKSPMIQNIEDHEDRKA
ncbi:MAG: CDP-alcohol phosphatidyltransferase family protein [Oscillospiraceae bacterium]|nr:CDP-alcohol phosphatidyltransferase family protein [Oscillospiraceae bacterium]